MNLLEDAYPVLLRLPGGTRWWLCGDELAEAARRATRAIQNPAEIPGGQVLKRGTRRLVFVGGAGAPRCGGAASDTAEADDPVIKAFPLQGLRSRLKHRKYAYSEAANLTRARRLAVPAPRVYGWGEQRRLGLVVWNAVIMQRVAGRPFSDAFAGAPDDAARRELLERCALLFRALYRAGCNHIDLKPDAIRLGQRPEDDCIIDFQYCTFRDHPSISTLMAQVGHFVHWWERQDEACADWFDHWMETLLELVEVPATRRRYALAILNANRRRIRSIAERLEQ